jgi:hypothetical protein
MYVQINLSGPCRTQCDRCRSHGQCFPISDDQAVRKRFCVECITKVLRGCQPGMAGLVPFDTASPPVPVVSLRHSFSPLTFTREVNHVHTQP